MLKLKCKNQYQWLMVMLCALIWVAQATVHADEIGKQPVFSLAGNIVTVADIEKRLQLPKDHRFTAMPKEHQLRLAQSLAMHFHMLALAQKELADDKDAQKKLVDNLKNVPDEYKPIAKENILVGLYRDKITKQRYTPEVEAKAFANILAKQSAVQHQLSVVKFADEDAAKQWRASVSTVEEAKKQSKADIVEMGYVDAQTLPDALSVAVKELKKGDISSPVKTDFGWHILLVEETKALERSLPDGRKDEIRELIQGQLWMDYVQQEMQKADFQLLLTDK